MTRAALYIRVSTREQTTENQERALRSWAERLGVEVVAVHTDTASGTRGDRAALADALAGAHRREFGVLLVWALDRLSREGIRPMLRYLDQLRTAGVRVMSHREPWLDTAGPTAELLLAVFAWVAKPGAGSHRRARARRARAQGVHIRRKPRLVNVEEVGRRRDAGQGWRRIARALKTPTTTLRRKFEAYQKSIPVTRYGVLQTARVSAEAEEGAGT